MFSFQYYLVQCPPKQIFTKKIVSPNSYIHLRDIFKQSAWFWIYLLTLMSYFSFFVGDLGLKMFHKPRSPKKHSFLKILIDVTKDSKLDHCCIILYVMKNCQMFSLTKYSKNAPKVFYSRLSDIFFSLSVSLF